MELDVKSLVDMKKTDNIILLIAALCSIMMQANMPSFAQSARDTITTYYTIDSSKISAVRPMVQHGNDFSIDPERAAKLVSVIGEPDVMRQITLLPGVSQGMDGTLGFFVRGAGGGGNKVEIDGVALHNNSHLFGMVSALPSEMISTVDFYSGGAPMSSANLSSSLTSVMVKDAHVRNFNGSFSLSPYMTSIYTAIPVVKDKVSMRISARGSGTPYIIGAVIRNSNDLKNSSSLGITDIGGYAYDVMATLRWDISKRWSSHFMLYSTRDDLDLSASKYGRTYIDMLSYEHMFKAGVIGALSDGSRITASVSGDMSAALQRQIFKTSITPVNFYAGNVLSELDVKARYEKKSGRWNFSSGVAYKRQKFNPCSEMAGEHTSLGAAPVMSADLMSLFAEASYGEEGEYEFSAGARPNILLSSGDVLFNVDLKAMARVNITKNIGVEISGDRMTQYFHVLEGLPAGWNQTLMVPATKNLPAEVTHQAFAGLFSQFESGRNLPSSFRASVGAFYRHMNGFVSYKDARSLFTISDEDWRESTTVGRGRSYGIESALSCESRYFNLNMSYTYSRAFRQYDELNFGREFLFKFDRPHNFKLQVDVNIPSAFKQFVGLMANYSSGHLMTAVTGQMNSGLPVDIPIYNEVEEKVEMNNFRLPYYFRVDLSYNAEVKKGKNRHLFTVSIFNLLNRKNPYHYFYDYDGGKWRQLSIFPLMPSFRWALVF